MSTSVYFRYGLLQLCLVGAAGITYILGLIIHFFMVGVSVIDWLKRRPLTTVDHLILFIVTSRITFQVNSLFHVFWMFFNGKVSLAYDIAVNVIGSSSVDCNIWLSVLLSVFYSLKISNIQKNFFTSLKKMILQRVLGLIAGFVLLSIGSISVEILTFHMIIPSIPRNSTQGANLYIAGIMTLQMSLFFLRTVLPLLFYVISSSAVLGFLCHYVYRMNREKNITSHMDTYFRTIKFTIVSFFCLALYVINNMFGIYLLGFVGCFLVGNCFLVLHSLYLIYMTARLRKHFFHMSHFLTNLLRKRSGPTSEVQVQIISK